MLLGLTGRLILSMAVGQAILGGARLAGPPHGESLVLTWPTVVEMARKQGPEVVLAEAARREAAAGLNGAALYSQQNPDLSGVFGPHYPKGAPTYGGGYFRLSWPFPVAGDFASRRRLASRQIDAAELNVRNALRVAAVEALSRVLDAQAARDLRSVASRRLAWDEDIVRLAEEHHALPGPMPRVGDRALARLLFGQQQAVLRRSEAEEEASLARLRRSIGLRQDQLVGLPETLSQLPEPPGRDQLLERLPRRPDLRQTLSSLEVARANEQLQNRLAVPVPSLVIFGGGSSAEPYGLGGVGFPLPVYQRNQQARSIAEATVGRRNTEAQQALAQAESDLFAAYAQWEGEAAALDSLVQTEKMMGEAERISQAAYSRGEATLDQVVVARREGNQAHIALVELHRAVGRARLNLALVAGEPLPMGEPQESAQ